MRDTFAQIWNSIIESAISFLPFMGIAIAVSLTVWIVHWFLIGRHPDLGNEKKFPRQLMMLGLFFLSLLVVVFALPISESSRNQVLGLMGILISGILALSSTTIVSNLIAGVLLRNTKPFKIGDFIRVGDHFGRVSERGLFDTEIQTEERELIDLPNTYLISKPVTTIRGTGAVVSASLSLGYDIGHAQIEPLLIKAAEMSGLEEPFVHILELGNYAVTYRISGILPESKRFITARTKLYRHVLDTLHQRKIEIMSPAYMNQRRLGENQLVLPAGVQAASSNETECASDDIVFDKAERAETLENEKNKLTENIEKLEIALKAVNEKGEKDAIKKDIERNRQRLKDIQQDIEKSTLDGNTRN